MNTLDVWMFGQPSFQVWILFIQVLQDPSIQSTWPDNALSCSINTTRVYRQIIKLLAAFETFPFSNDVLLFLLWIFLSVKWCPLKQNKNIMKDPTGYVLIFLLQGWIHWPHTCMYGLLHKVLMLHSKNWQHQLNTTINQLFLSHSVTGLQGIATLNGLELKSLVGIPIWNLV